MFKFLTSSLSILLISVVFQACNTTPPPATEIVLNIRESAGASSIHPTLYNDELSGNITTYIFQTLTVIDFNTLELSPLLADSLPKITVHENGNTSYSYRIREEAKWDNGDAITAKDAEFAIKMNLIPNPEGFLLNSFYETILNFEYHPTNPNAFTVHTTGGLVSGDFLCGDISFLPAFLYDSTGYLEHFTVKQLLSNPDSLAKDSSMVAFLNQVNNFEFKINPTFIQGSGPYALTDFNSESKFVLQKKKDWWGNHLSNTGTEFQANVDKIVIHVIPDETTALAALKNGNIDLMRGVSPKEFSSMQTNATFSEKFNFVTSEILAYYSIGLNLNHPILSNKNNRKALAHLVDVEKIIDIVAYGYGERVVGPLPLKFENQYNKNITPYPFNPEKAKELLALEGWKDLDGDGVLNQTIDGIKTNFELDYLFNSGNDSRKTIGLIMQEEAAKVGIQINLLEVEWSIFLEKSRNSDFDLCFTGKMFAPLPRNHENIFHSNAISDGSNFVGFNSLEVDVLIDSINKTYDPKIRLQLNYRFQEILHDELPYIFLYAPLERMIISNRFTNYSLSSMRPGFWAPGFKLNE
jgi:peptide/nickel transport system substrate-binding protein